MLVLLSEYLAQFYSGFTVFQYITVRTIMGVLTALIVALMVGPWMIRRLSIRQIGQVVRDDGPESHLSKAGTPTMGGALILVGIALSTILWADLRNPYVWVSLAVTLSFGAVGWVDDYRKVFRKDPTGLPARWKYFWQSAIGLTAAVYLYMTATDPVQTSYIIPFFKDVSLDVGILYLSLIHI